jgi:hypothetical protein
MLFERGSAGGREVLMERSDGRRGAGSPQGVKRHAEPTFSFAIDVPRRFIGLPGTVDPVAQLLRGGAMMPADKVEGVTWPAGLCDPEVLGPLDDGALQPLRTLEIDTLRRDEPLTDDEAASFWFEARQVLPTVLASAGLPGYRLLDVCDTTLGPLDGLAFEWRWDGMTTDDVGGDRALLIWAFQPERVFHVCYHCPGDQWERRLPEFRAIVDSFEVL